MNLEDQKTALKMFEAGYALARILHIFSREGAIETIPLPQVEKCRDSLQQLLNAVEEIEKRGNKGA